MPDGDIFIHCGDALGRGSHQEMLVFNEWLGTLPHKHKIYVPGNHDLNLEMNQPAAIKAMTNAVVLIDAFIEIEGLKIYGTPWTNQFGVWSFMKADHKLEPTFSKIPEGLDILISHGPPYEILDANDQGILCGSYSLQRAVFEKKPRFHLFGHIHESSGIKTIGETTYVNASVLDDRYVYIYPPKIIEITRK